MMMVDTATAPSTSHQQLRRTGRWVVGVFWLVQFCELTAVSLAEGSRTAIRMLEARSLVLLAGIVLTLIFVEVAASLNRAPFRTRLVLTLLAALGFCLVLVTINYCVFYIRFTTGRIAFDVTEYVYTAFAWSWFFFSIAGAILALSYSIDVRAREVRLSALELVAQDAQMAALRYQLNPHFLFNTLNSIAALVGRDDRSAAEKMVENLSDFLRATLELDPLEDVSLAREIELQALYLAIEQVRFPTRLTTAYDVPRDLRGAMVPALITQPLVENAVRHAVARSEGRVKVHISARPVNGRLEISVEDDGKTEDARPANGTGLGLNNVRARLQGRFGEEQSVTAEMLSSGGFRSTVSFPWRMGR